MTQSQDETYKKWESLFRDITDKNNQQFPSILPIAKRVAASTIGGLQGEELEKLKGKVLSENRESKINSVIEGTKHVEKDIKDYPEYIESRGIVSVKPMSAPSSQLFYIDYKYEKKDKNWWKQSDRKLKISNIFNLGYKK